MAAVSVLTVLVVEDDGFVREDIVLGLRREGWIVLEAATGAGALKALQETKIVDLLITDISLTDALTGWDIADTFRALSPIGAVIYASGSASNDGRRVPESIFLSKPVGPRELLAACRRFFPGAQ